MNSRACGLNGVGCVAARYFHKLPDRATFTRPLSAAEHHEVNWYMKSINQEWQRPREAIDLLEKLNIAETLFEKGDRSTALHLVSTVADLTSETVHPNVVDKLNVIFEKFSTATRERNNFAWKVVSSNHSMKNKTN